jgi:Arc/MetJ family transcription regulator
MERRTTIEVDEDLLRKAQEVLGTKGLKDTVHRAMDEVVKAALRRRLAEKLADGTAFDVEVLGTVRETGWRA